MRIVIDLDGTICHLKNENQTYDQVLPIIGVKETLENWKNQGHIIIIQTARNMATQQSNVGKVMKNVGLITLNWLEKYKIPYDEIYFGKPNGHIYIDDRALRFNSWDSFTDVNIETLGQEK
jgi:capsule biosynthesis phosphatase